MRHVLKGRLFSAFVLAAALGLAVGASAQTVTTGAISGLVSDESGGVLPGASVVAVHAPTGTQYTGVTDADGRFALLNVRAGGPYGVTVSLSGFKEQKQSDVSVALGATRALNFRLQLESISEVVEVVAPAASVINPLSNGPASNVSEETLQSLPTIGRGLDDFTRLNPYFASTAIGGTISNGVSVAGRNNRYNNIQIDGAVNNDLFGLAANGAPGGQADTQPISLDAIQEIQLLVAPYDVRQGGFSGGGINAITKSGANDFFGTAYWFWRNQGLVGDGPLGTTFGDFTDKQFGASVGGPIMKDKAFFFVNADLARRNVPNGFAIGGSTGQDFGHQAEAQRFVDILSQYGYDPGPFNEEFIRTTHNNKIFARLDFNLSPQHRLTLRHNYIDGVNDLYGSSNSSTTFNFPDHPYQFNSTTNSTVLQLNSTFGSAVNELRLTYQRIRESRGHVTDFPQVQVDLADGSRLLAGTEQFSTANALDQDIFELTDDYTFTRGKHSITVGTHNEFFKFRNLFIRDNFGTYRFTSLDNFAAGFAQQYDYSFSVTGDPQQPARFKVNQLGFYVGDVWRVTPRVTLTLGVRLDKPFFPDKPTANSASVQAFGFATDVVPNPTMFSPRAGFNWDIEGNGKRQLRGGLGLFSGRTPYVWLSNQYGNSGIEFQRIGAGFNNNNRIPFVTDPHNQPTSVTGASAGTFTNEVDLVDPDYKYPQVFRGNLAYDHDLGWWGMVGTVEFFGSKTIKDIAYNNLNRVPGPNTLFDGRPIFVRRVPSLSDAVLLTNTSDGSQWSLSGKLERPFRNGLYASASYIYGRSKSVNDGTSSQALSNWRFVYVPGDINNPPVTYSNFDLGSRINVALSYELKVLEHFHPVVSLFYNGQSGRPYSVLFNTDVNGDGTTGNDLLFVPNSVDDVIVRGGTPQQLEDFIAGDPGLSANRGKIVPRNASRSSWTNSLDFRLGFEVPFNEGKRKLEFTIDVFNVLNLLSSSWGRFDFTSNQNIAPIRYGGIDSASGKPIYDISTLASPTFTKFITDDLRSRWQAQFGARFRF
jgi:outer membrane receptor for ferrienterochelin and colicin